MCYIGAMRVPHMPHPLAKLDLLVLCLLHSIAKVSTQDEANKYGTHRVITRISVRVRVLFRSVCEEFA